MSQLWKTRRNMAKNLGKHWMKPFIAPKNVTIVAILCLDVTRYDGLPER